MQKTKDYYKPTPKNIISYKRDICNHNGQGFTAEMSRFAHHYLKVQEKVHWTLEEGNKVQIIKIKESSSYMNDLFSYRIDHGRFKFGKMEDILDDLKEQH